MRQITRGMRYAECVVVTRRLNRKKQLFAALLAGGATTCVSVAASAQTSTAETIALNAQAVVLHYNPNGSASSHPNGAQPTWISHADCEANVHLAVALTLTGSPLNVPVQTWAAAAGVDCTDPNQRAGTVAQCWQVANSQQPATVMTININAQDIVGPITLASGQKPTTYTPGTAAACDTFSQSGPVPITLFFLPIGNGQILGTAATYGISVALIGPSAPVVNTVGAGDTLLKVDWTPASDANTQGFQVFCDPPRGKEDQASDSGGGASVTTNTVLVCADGGTTDGGFDDAGNYLGDIAVDGGCFEENQASSDSGSSGGVCSSSVIFSGGGTATTTGDSEGGTAATTVTGATPPPANIGDYSCGSAGSPTSTEAIVSGLKNGQKYVIGVAAYDVVGNVGPMSIPQCEDPTPVDDFWKDYKIAGGGAGGGFCSVDKTSEPASLSAFGLVGIASIVSVWRRRKKKKMSNTSRDS